MRDHCSRSGIVQNAAPNRKITVWQSVIRKALVASSISCVAPGARESSAEGWGHACPQKADQQERVQATAAGTPAIEVPTGPLAARASDLVGREAQPIAGTELRR